MQQAPSAATLAPASDGPSNFSDSAYSPDRFPGFRVRGDIILELGEILVAHHIADMTIKRLNFDKCTGLCSLCFIILQSPDYFEPKLTLQKTTVLFSSRRVVLTSQAIFYANGASKQRNSTPMAEYIPF